MRESTAAACIARAVKLAVRRRNYLSGKTRQEVARNFDAPLNARKKGQPFPGERLTTAAFLISWLEDTVKPSLKPLTYENYKQVVNTI